MTSNEEVSEICKIGKGYRNVVYQSSKTGGTIILYGYDENGRPATFKIPHICTAKYEVKYPTNQKSIFNTNIATKNFDTSYERWKWLQSLSDNVKVFEAFRPEVEFLHQHFSRDFLKEDFNTQPLRTHYIDIEVAVEDTWCEPQEAGFPINLITIYDSHYKRYYSWVLGDVKNTLDDKDIIIFKFKDEAELLKSFLDWFKINYPDVITGWNIRNFDIVYIIRRLENVLGIKAAEQISPVRKYRYREGHDVKGRPTANYTIEGITQLDLLVLYRDKFKIAQALDGGYNLDNVGEHELGERKLQYEGTFRDFYRRDFQKFFEYNIRDVELTVKLEEKLQLIPLARRISTFGLCELESIYYSLPYLIGSLNLFSYQHLDKVFPSYRNAVADTNTSFEGAYVFPTEAGFYKEGVACIDLNSLYPNTIISINCSPETKVGQLINNEDDTYTIRGNNGKSKDITSDELTKILNDKCILSKNNTLFLKHDQRNGIIPQWSEYFYNYRKNTKKTEYKYVKELSKLEKDDPLYDEVNSKVKLYHSIQISIKDAINSVYGILGTRFSPIYDVDLAQSITLNGQFVNKSVATFVEEEFKKRYDIEYDFRPSIAGDTDSNFLNIKPLTEKYAKKFDIKPMLSKFTRTQFKELSKELDDFVENDINDYVENLINTECYTTKGNHVVYGREYIASEGMFFKKKHYLVHIIDDEGTKTDKFKYSGIAVKKTQLPAEMKPLLKHIYESTCNEHWTYVEYQNYLNEVFNKFKDYDFENISMNQKYSTAKESIGYLQSEKGTQAAVRSSHYYNQLLKDFKLSNKYDEIRLDDVIKYVYVFKNNPYHIDVIGYKDMLPQEFKDIFKINYELMFQKLFIDPLDGYINAMNFNKYQPSNQMEVDIFSL